MVFHTQRVEHLAGDEVHQLLHVLAGTAVETRAGRQHHRARVVGLSAPAVHERVGKLEAAGVITGYHATVSPEALGYSTNALIGLFLGDAADADAVAAALANVPEVEDCWFVAGEESYVVKVRVMDVSALERMIGTLNAILGISRTRTTVVLSTKFEGRVQPAG